MLGYVMNVKFASPGVLIYSFISLIIYLHFIILLFVTPITGIIIIILLFFILAVIGMDNITSKY